MCTSIVWKRRLWHCTGWRTRFISCIMYPFAGSHTQGAEWLQKHRDGGSWVQSSPNQVHTHTHTHTHTHIPHLNQHQTFLKAFFQNTPTLTLHFCLSLGSTGPDSRPAEVSPCTTGLVLLGLVLCRLMGLGTRTEFPAWLEPPSAILTHLKCWDASHPPEPASLDPDWHHIQTTLDPDWHHAQTTLDPDWHHAQTTPSVSFKPQLP